MWIHFTVLQTQHLLPRAERDARVLELTSPCPCAFSPQGSAIRGPPSASWSGDTKRWFRSESGFRPTGRRPNPEKSWAELSSEEEEEERRVEEKQLHLCWELRGVCLQRATDRPRCLLQHIEASPQPHPVRPCRLTFTMHAEYRLELPAGRLNMNIWRITFSVITHLKLSQHSCLFIYLQLSSSVMSAGKRSILRVKWGRQDCVFSCIKTKILAGRRFNVPSVFTANTRGQSQKQIKWTSRSLFDINLPIKTDIFYT